MSIHENNKPAERGPSTRIVVVFVVAVAVALAAGVGFGTPIKEGVRKLGRMWSGEAERGEKGWHTCGMHPWVLLPKPGLCPICQMELTPVDPSKLTGEIELDPRLVQNIGIRVEPVTKGPLRRVVRTVGKIEYDERLTRDVVARADGLIEKLYANYEGKHVTAGETLADFHSPAAMAAGYELTAATGESLVEATKQKLRILGVPDDVIEQIRSTGQVPRTFPLRSPITGVVMKMGGHEGHWLTKGADLAEITDHSKVWVNVAVYESDLPFIKLNQSAKMTLPYLPGRSFEGKVIYMHPHLDEGNRQLVVRLEFENSDLSLRPGMFSQVELASEIDGEATLAPRSAIIDTGKRQVAFVSLGDGKFEPRELKLGMETEDGNVQVVEGLKPGEPLVVSGQFLLDGEARFRESLLKMVRGTSAVSKAASVVASLPDEAAKHLAALLDAYLAIGQSLAADKLDGASEQSQKLSESVDALNKTEIPGHEHFWHEREKDVKVIADRAGLLGKEKDIEQARIHYGHMSDALERVVTATGVPGSYGKPVFGFVCGMFDEAPRKGVWLQVGDKPGNPYMGKKMPRCKTKDYPLPVTGKIADKE